MPKESDRRQRILAEATRHFLRDGYDRTSTDRVAAAARVSKQAIYELFRNKTDLFEQSVLHAMQREVRIEVAGSAELPIMIDRHATALFDMFARPQNFGLFRANIVASRQFPELATALHSFRRNSHYELAAYLAEAADAGAIRCPPAGATELGTRLGGIAVEGMRFFLGYDLPNKKGRAAQAAFAARLFLNGVPRDRSVQEDPASSSDEGISRGPSLARTSRLGSDKLELLCSTAADEFLEFGFEAASIDRIIEASSISRATIYRQFVNKEGLFTHALDWQIAQADMIEMPNGEGSFDDLRAFCRLVLDRHLEERTIKSYRLLAGEALLFPDLARRFYERQVARVATPFTHILRELTGVDPTAATLRACHTLATFGARYVVSSEALSVDERARVSDQAASLILFGAAA